MFKATFKNISVVPGENHRAVANHWTSLWKDSNSQQPYNHDHDDGSSYLQRKM